MVHVCRFTRERVVAQGSPDSGKVQELSSSDSSSSSSTSVLELTRPFYKEGILFPDPIAWLPPIEEEEEGEVTSSFNLDHTAGAPRRMRRPIIKEGDH